MRGAGGAVLEAGGSEVLRRVPGEAVSGVAAESLLPDVDSRTPAAASKKAAEGSGLDEGAGASQAGQERQAALRLCNLVAPGTGDAQGAVQAGGGEGTDGAGNGTVGDYLLQTVPEPDASH